MVEIGKNRIEDDFAIIRDEMVQYVKSIVNTLKNGVIKRFSELNNSNIRALGSLSSKIQTMVKASNDINEALNSALIRHVENTKHLEKIITGRKV